jgi:hypothetical protein
MSLGGVTRSERAGVRHIISLGLSGQTKRDRSSSAVGAPEPVASFGRLSDRLLTWRLYRSYHSHVNRREPHIWQSDEASRQYQVDLRSTSATRSEGDSQPCLVLGRESIELRCQRESLLAELMPLELLAEPDGHSSFAVVPS